MCIIVQKNHFLKIYPKNDNKKGQNMASYFIKSLWAIHQTNQNGVTFIEQTPQKPKWTSTNQNQTLLTHTQTLTNSNEFAKNVTTTNKAYKKYEKITLLNCWKKVQISLLTKNSIIVVTLVVERY